ncbi:hypothetical protein NQ317_001923 [Molorchus minor]|uniref:Protein hunchback n=1 Tax=Molorchus minor TaxID=1323400 RepID=A0ABQ9JFC5_9CUCU|nr:hypothetical protein NQ317_001923 [Molorchus minor]
MQISGIIFGPLEAHIGLFVFNASSRPVLWNLLTYNQTRIRKRNSPQTTHDEDTSMSVWRAIDQSCADTREKIIKYCGQVDTNKQDLVELNHVQMYKCIENECEIRSIRTLSENIGNNEDHDIVELMACKSCMGSLARYLRFATVCATTEEKITKYCRQIDTNGQDPLELNQVRMFCNQNESEIPRKRTLSGIIGKIGNGPTENDGEFCVKSVSCVVQQKTECLDNVAHSENSEMEMYECETCHFKTKYKRSLKSHRLVHRENSEVNMHECELCHFKTKHKGSLKYHLLLHKANSEVEMYECETCQFKTKHKNALRMHVLVHKANSEVEMYECEICQFRTKHKGVHKADSEVKMYECEMCPFKAKLKYILKRHLLVHREASEVEMYKCEMCPYKSKYKRNLKHHLLVHRENSEVKMYACKMCDFKTKRKWGIKKHLLVHREMLK